MPQPSVKVMTLNKFEYTPLVYSREGNIATLEEDIRIVLYTTEGTYVLDVAAGFKWNGNSGAIPCRFHKTNVAYNVIILVHDVLYHRVGLSKADADDILRGGLRESGYGRIMAGIIHQAVTQFGWKSFNSDDEMTLDNLDYITINKIEVNNETIDAGRIWPS